MEMKTFSRLLIELVTVESKDHQVFESACNANPTPHIPA